MSRAERPTASAASQAGPVVVRKGVPAALVAGFVLGANVFAVLGYLLSNPGQRPASWPGWNLLFDGLAFGLPLLLAGLALWPGRKGRLPGVRGCSPPTALEGLVQHCPKGARAALARPQPPRIGVG